MMIDIDKLDHIENCCLADTRTYVSIIACMSRSTLTITTANTSLVESHAQAFNDRPPQELSATHHVTLHKLENDASTSTFPLAPVAIGPSADLAPGLAPPADLGSTSPCTAERQRCRDLTLPSHPDLSIPESPPGSPSPALTSKFQNFLDLKARGVHFNERLAKSSALRNPALFDRLMVFAGVVNDDDASRQYESALPSELALKTTWPEWAYTDNMLRAHAEKRKNLESDRIGKKREFVPAVNGNEPGNRPAKKNAGQGQTEK